MAKKKIKDFKKMKLDALKTELIANRKWANLKKVIL